MKPEEIRNLCSRYLHQNDTNSVFLREIAAQLAELNQNLRDIHPELNLPKECREQKCTYFAHYLAYGGPDLTHEGFHAAEKICESTQKRMQEWMDNPANEGRDIPKGLEEACKRAEERVRA